MKKRIRRMAGCAAVLMMSMTAAGAGALTLAGPEAEGTERTWEDSRFFTRMQTLTGVSMQAHAYADDEAYAQMLTAMEGGEIPCDVLFKASLSREKERALYKAGAIINLAPYLETCMPNLTALLDEHPQWRQAMELDEEGTIVSLPLLEDEPRQVMAWINTAWLERAGLDMPQSTEELTDVLAAMRGQDLNHNLKDDEIPADLLGVWEMRWLLPYFGIAADDYHLARTEAGEVVFAPELPEYRDFVQMLAEWYKRGILPKTAFTELHTTRELSGQKKDDVPKAGLMIAMAPHTQVPAEYTEEYEPLLMPDKTGRTVWRDLLGPVWTGCFAVTSACEDIEAALRWADALYGREGALLGYIGVEDEDYIYTQEGYWQLASGLGRSAQDILSRSVMYTGTAMPGYAPTDFLKKADNAQDRHVLQANARTAAVAVQVTQPRLLSEEETARAGELSTAIGRIAESGIAAFATGVTELTDENWQAWLQAMRDAGSEELTALFAGK